MAQSKKLIFSINWLNKAVTVLLAAVIFISCNSQPSQSATKALDTIPKVAPENRRFTAHLIETASDCKFLSC